MGKKLDPDKTATQKALLLYSLLLFSGRKYYLADLAQKFQCAKPTIMRLMEEIETSGVGEIHTGLTNGKRWYQASRLPSLPSIALTSEEIERISLCTDLVEHIFPGGMERIVSNGLAKMASLIQAGDDKIDIATPKAKNMTQGYIDYTPFQNHIDTLIKAIRSHSICSIAYLSPNNPVKVFYIIPVRLTMDNEVLNIEGWRVTHDSYRNIRFPTTLAIHRIKECKVTDETVNTYPSLPELQGAFGLIGAQAFPARILFSSNISQYIKERMWGGGYKIISNTDGSIELSLFVSGPNYFISWILSFGSDAELLEPIELRHKLKKIIKNTYNIYK